MMRFLVDAQLPPKLAVWLQGKGHEAEHVVSVLGETAPDAMIFARAVETGSVIVTKDLDFLSLCDNHAAPPLLWIAIGNAINRTLFEQLDREWLRIERELSEGKAVVELP